MPIQNLIRAVIIAILFNISFTSAKSFHDITAPIASNETTIYGSTSNGCIIGASTLPITGTGYQVMRNQRNRYYGHPNLIQFVENLGEYASSRDELLLLGDLSQPAGGRMPSDHASHQSGLDIDIWFSDLPPNAFREEDRNMLKIQSVADLGQGRLNQRWKPQYFDLLKKVATDPSVDRIFINPIIKKAVCQNTNVSENHNWLRKLRPWWGHNAHFHVRLKCPSDQPFCQSQAPIPEGSGCTEDLDNWVNDQIIAINQPKQPAKKTTSTKKKKVLPVQCQALLMD